MGANWEMRYICVGFGAGKLLLETSRNGVRYWSAHSSWFALVFLKHHEDPWAYDKISGPDSCLLVVPRILLHALPIQPIHSWHNAQRSLEIPSNRQLNYSMPQPQKKLH